MIPPQITKFLKNNKILSKVFFGVIGLNFSSKLISFIKELFVTKYIGISPHLDSFFISQNVYNIIINILFVGITTCIIPIVVKFQNKEEIESQNRIIGKVFLVGLLIALFIAFLLIVFSFSYILINKFEYNSDEIYTIKLVIYLVPYLLFSYLNLFYSAILSVKNYFFWATMSSALPSILTILLLLFNFEIDQVFMQIIGLNIGSLMVFLILYFQNKIKGFKMILNLNFPFNLKSFIKETFYMSSANSLTSVNSIIDQSMAVRLGSNNVSYLEYGNKLQAFFSGIIINSLNLVFTPYFSKMAILNDSKQIQKDLIKLSLSLLLPGIIFSLIIAFNSESIIKILFMRGKFNYENVVIISKVLNCFLVGFPFYITGILGVRMITSMGENKYLILLSFTNMSMNIIFNIIFISFLGLYGIALSTSFVYIINTIIIYFIIFKLLAKRNVKKESSIHHI